jgi:hypothetical protein
VEPVVATAAGVFTAAWSRPLPFDSEPVDDERGMARSFEDAVMWSEEMRRAWKC